MSQQISHCPDAEALHAFLMDQSSSEESAQVEAHLLQCRRCIEAMSNLNDGNVTADALQSLAANGQSLDPSQVRPFVARLKVALRSENAVFERATIDVAGEVAGSASVGNAHHQIDFLTPPESDDEIGRLGSCRILEVLGKGGMGMVFRAQDTQLDRMVALKVMLPALAADESARQRFLREAKATATLTHDNIVSIHQVGAVNGVPFIAMPLLKGHALDSILKKGKRLGIPHILRIALQTAQGLAAAHEAGLVHRDIKPSNLWIEPDGGGRVKIVDFGLARASTADKEQGHEQMRLTKTGVILGTPAYMAPEQARSESEVDHRCDLFSLGCVLYELCTGELPFRGADITAVLLSLVMDDPLPPHRIRDEIPLELSDFIMNLLSKEPADRPQTAQEVGAFLRKLQRQIANRNEPVADKTEAIPAPDNAERTTPTIVPIAKRTAVAPKRRRRWPILIVITFLVVVVGYFFGPPMVESIFDSGDSGPVEKADKKGGRKTPPPERKSEGAKGEWQYLFNGKDLSGLNIWWGPKHWHVKDGNLIGKGAAAIGTIKTYRDYVFKFDVRYPFDKNLGLASVFLHADLNDKKLLDDFIQIKLGEPRLGEIMVKMGNRTPTTNASQELVKKAIQSGWNTFTITSKGGEIAVELNDVEICRGKSPIIREGSIGFHAISNPVEFRNIRIQEFEGGQPAEPGWTKLFDGKQLAGLVATKGKPRGTWRIKDRVLLAAGILSMRTEKPYQNYILRFDVRKLDPEKSGWFDLFLHNSAGTKTVGAKKTGRFSPYVRVHGLGDPFFGEISINDPKGKKRYSRNAKAEVVAGWNAFEIISQDGVITLKVNDEVVNRTPALEIRKGFIVFGVTGTLSPFEFRNIRIKELDDLKHPEIGWVDLFNGKDLTSWKTPLGNCTVKDGVLQIVATGRADSERTHSRNCIIQLAFRASPASNGQLRIQDGFPGFRLGDYVSLGEKQLATHAKSLGEWNDLQFICADRTIKVSLNGHQLEKTLRNGKDYKDGVSLTVTTGKIEFRNIRVKDLGSQKLAEWLAGLERAKPLRLMLRHKIPTIGSQFRLRFLEPKYLEIHSASHALGSLWDITTGRPALPDTKASGGVYSDEYKRFAYHAQERKFRSPWTIHLAPLSADDGPTESWKIKQQGIPVYAFVPKHPFLAFLDDGMLQFRHLNENKIHSLKLDGNYMYQFAFSSDGTRVATRTSKTITIWDWQNNKQLWSMPKVNKKFHVVAGDLLAVWAEGGPYLLRKFSNGELHGVLKIDEILDVSPNGKQLLVRRGRPTLYTYDGTLIGSLKELDPAIKKGPSDILHSFSGDGKWILALRNSGQFHVLFWSTQTLDCVQSIDLPFSLAGCNFAMSNDGKALAIALGTSFEAAQGDREGMVYVFDIAQVGP